MRQVRLGTTVLKEEKLNDSLMTKDTERHLLVTKDTEREIRRNRGLMRESERIRKERRHLTVDSHDATWRISAVFLTKCSCGPLELNAAIHLIMIF